MGERVKTDMQHSLPPVTAQRTYALNNCSRVSLTEEEDTLAQLVLQEEHISISRKAPCMHPGVPGLSNVPITGDTEEMPLYLVPQHDRQRGMSGSSCVVQPHEGAVSTTPGWLLWNVRTAFKCSKNLCDY